MDDIAGFKALKQIQIGQKDGEEKRASGEEEPLSPMARLFHEPGSNIYIITIIGWKNKICPHVLKANLGHTIMKHPRFSSLQVVNKENGEEIKWVKTAVNLENHIFVPEVQVSESESGDKLVEEYVSNLSKTSIEMWKPMWDFHLLNIKTSDAEAVGVLRVHHSIADGLSLMSLLLAGTHKTSDPTPTAVNRSNLSSDNSSRFKHFMRMIWNSIAGVMMFVLTALFFEDTNTPIKGLSGVEFNPRRFVYRTVNLDDFKLVKNSLKVTVNDVVLGVTQAGLSTYLNRRYDQGKKDDDGVVKKEHNLPNKIRLRATFFMNLRASSGINALGDMMAKSSEARWGNKIGYVVLPFTIAFRNNPLDYIHEAKDAMNKKKNSIEASYSYFITKYVLKFFGSKALGILSHRIFSHTTLWFSNVPGPREEIAFCGHPIAYLAPSCYGQPNALMIHVVSYVNKMTFMLSADEETIPDPHQLCDDLEDSLKLIKDAVLAPKLV